MFQDCLKKIKKNSSHLSLDKVRKRFPGIDEKITKLEKTQGHNYKDTKIAALSLIHSSSLVQWPKNKSGVESNERLEFLGDAFLNFYTASKLMSEFPAFKEGQLSKLRAAIVGTENLAQKARRLNLARFVIAVKPNKDEQFLLRDSILADLFESVTAALLLDAGYKKTSSWLDAIFKEDFINAKDILESYDVKSKLQQYIQSLINVPPNYELVGEESTARETFFIVAAFIGDKEISRGKGLSKKSATKDAAKITWQKIQKGELTKESIKAFYEESQA